MGFIWSEGFSVLYVEPNPGIKRPAFGYMFRKAGSRIVETRPADNIETGAKWVRVVDAFDPKNVSGSAGYRLFNTVQ